MFCPNCGKANDDNALHCASCGAALGEDLSSVVTQSGQQPTVTLEQNPTTSSKSKLAAGLLAIFLGIFGIHNFYLGYKKKGAIQLIITIVSAPLFGIGALIVEIWSIYEGVMYLTGGKKTDADGNLLT